MRASRRMAPVRGDRAAACRAASRRDRGQAALEYAGTVALLLFVAIAALQLGIAGYAIQQAGTGARAAARTATYRETEGDDYQAAGRDAISGWLAGGARFSASDSGTGVTVTARIHIPALVPLLDLGDATRTVTMPRDRLTDQSQGAHQHRHRYQDSAQSRTCPQPHTRHQPSLRPRTRPQNGPPIQVLTPHHSPGAAP